MVSSMSPQFSPAAEKPSEPLRVDEGTPPVTLPLPPRFNPNGTEAVRFKTIRGINAQRPAILGFVDDTKVTWEPAGWDCECDAPEREICIHIHLALKYIDPSIFILRTRRAVIL